MIKKLQEKPIGIAIATCSIYIREDTDTKSKAITVIPKGTKLEVLEKQKDWFKVNCPKSSTGYGYTLIKGYEYKENKLPSNVFKSEQEPAKKSKEFEGEYKFAEPVPLRHGPGTDKSIITSIPKNVIVNCDGSFGVYNKTKWPYVHLYYKSIHYYGFISATSLAKAQ